MEDMFFGTKELYEVVLRANTTMTFGSRKVEIGEPIMYFEKVNFASLNEQSQPKFARGGWGNMPFVVWDDRSEMTFSLSEGVMSSVGMGILLSADMKPQSGNLYLPKREGPFTPYKGKYTLERKPTPNKKIFCFEFFNDTIQRKVSNFSIEGNTLMLESYDESKTYLLDYYFQYGDDALVYEIKKERFNGTFSLEGKFYTKDEIDGLNSSNVLFMPKVRIVSDINLRLGERADPTVSVFNIIAMPDRDEGGHTILAKIVKLGEDIE